MTSRLTVLWRDHRAAVLAACAVAAVALAVAVIWPITDLIAAHDVGTIAGPSRAFHLQAARESVRTQLLTLGAGIFAAGALVYTARNFTLSRRTFDLTEQGQVTERYTKAIEQLGSSVVDVTIGGIYALERVARDSPRDHPTVIEVLAACIREHSREPLPRPTPGADTLEPATRPDIQAAVTVIGRRDTANDRRRINLRDAYLPDAGLTEAKLTSADLNGADLNGAHLFKADLSGADLNRAHLRGALLDGAYLPGAHLLGADLTLARLFKADLNGADLSGADFTSADLNGAHLNGAKLRRAHLTDAYLTGADLTEATLAGADLTGATLTGANLTYANLTDALLIGADLTGARLSPEAPVPDGWQRDANSGRLKRADHPGDAATD